MKAFIIIIFILTGSSFIYAQDKYIELKLNASNDKKTVPFFFREVIFSSGVSDTLGIIATQKNKDNTYAITRNNRSEDIYNFLSLQFEQNKKGTPVILEIKKLKLAPVKSGMFNFKDTFQFQCEFSGLLQNEKVPLYTFNAKNPFGTFEDAENVMAGYITRALVSAVEKFKESYNRKPEWHHEYANESNAQQKPVKVNIIKNQFSGNDTLSCESGHKLTWNDFQENKKDNSGLGSAKFILTYQASSEETDKHLKLDIYIKAFFNKRNSWKPQPPYTDEWINFQQGHFDICTAFANKLYNEMQVYKYSLGEYRAELNKIYNDVYSEYVKLRKQYNTETEDGSNKSQYIIWRNKIDKIIKDNQTEN